MAHVRQILRDAVVAAVNGLPTTGTRVYTDRVFVIQEAELPCLTVTVGDQVESDGIEAPVMQRRTLAVSVAAFVKGTSDVSDTLDQIGAEVEGALAAQISMGAKPVYLTYLGTETPTLDGDADRPVGTSTFTFELVAYTQASAPTAFI